MADDFSTYAGRQAYRDAHPGAIVDASGAYYPSSGQQVTANQPVASPTATVGGSSQQLSNLLSAAQGALASGNKQAFDEAVREYNQQYGFSREQYQESIRQYNENLGVTQAGLTGTYQGAPTQQALNQYANFLGTYQGAPTLQAQLQAANIAAQRAATAQQWAQLYGYTPQLDANGNPVMVGGETLAANQQRYAQQLGAIQAAAGLQANPFRQAQVIGQLGGVLGGGAVAGFQATGQATGQSDFSGMGNMQRMIDDIRGGPGAVNSQTTSSVLNAIPTPNKLDSVNFLRSSPNTQNIVLQGMQEKYGLSPEDSLAQIKNTLPQFQSPTTFGGVRR